MLDWMFVGKRLDNGYLVSGRSVINAIDHETGKHCAFIAESDGREAPASFVNGNLVRFEHLFYKVDPASLRLIADGNV